MVTLRQMRLDPTDNFGEQAPSLSQFSHGNFHFKRVIPKFLRVGFRVCFRKINVFFFRLESVIYVEIIGFSCVCGVF